MKIYFGLKDPYSFLKRFYYKLRGAHTYSARNSCWKNGFEHNKLVIFELKLQWVPQTFLCGSTWECVHLHEEIKIIY